MSGTVVLIIVIAAVGALALILLLLSLTGGVGGTRGQMRNIVAAQRQAGRGRRTAGTKEDPFANVDVGGPRKRTTSRLTLRKRLKYARWKLPPSAFRLLEIAISFVSISFVATRFNIVMQMMSLMVGPIFMNWLLNFGMDRRFKKFDSDYAQMLLSLVGLLKTGMQVMSALEAAAHGLEEGSLVKQEIEMMIERLRFGVSEDKSIGAFGEDVYHPEIELFVQALLLNRRVGGNLSDTLDRLSKQVRKRQQFRLSAVAAVGMQRGSIGFIILILLFLEGYLWFVYPESITGAWNDEFGWQVWQFGLLVILLGIFWIRQVTKIRV